MNFAKTGTYPIIWLMFQNAVYDTDANFYDFNTFRYYNMTKHTQAYALE